QRLGDVLQIRWIGMQALGELRPGDARSTVTVCASARREGTCAGLYAVRAVVPGRWGFGRVPLDRGFADVPERPGNDARVRLGRSHVIETAEEEHRRAD